MEVFFINDNIKTFDGDGELRLTIMATLAQDESRKTSVRVKAGQQTSMNNGVIYGNGNILGYDRVGKEMVINPEQAETVRMIYDLYLDGWGMLKIKRELERQGRLTSGGKKFWYPTVISHILKNSFYCGIITYHKEYTPDYLKQKRFKNYGEMEFTQVQGAHQPIVTVEEFERVQRIMDTKRDQCKNLETGRHYNPKMAKTTVWGRLLVCTCGHGFTKRVWHVKEGKPQASYYCYGVIHTGSYESRKKKGLPLDGVCQTPMIPEWKLKMMADVIFKKYLADKEKVLALANSMLEAHIYDAEEKVDNSTIIEQKRAELDKLSKKLDGYMEMRAVGDITRELFVTKSKELGDQIERLTAELAALEPQEPDDPIPNYEEKLTVLRCALEQYTNFDEEREIPDYVIEAFVEKIVASKDGFDWYLRFDGNPDAPLKCRVNEKRKSNAEVEVLAGSFPASRTSDTGCYRDTVPSIV